MVTKIFDWAINRFFSEEKAKDINEQRQRLYVFDKELESYTGMFPNGLTIFFSILTVLILMIPYQGMWDVSFLSACLVFSIFPGAFHRRATIQIGEGTNMVSVYDRIKHLPINKRVWVGVKMEYTLNLVIVLGIITAALQSLWAIIGGYFDFGNILYPFLFVAVVPVTWEFVLLCITVHSK